MCANVKSAAEHAVSSRGSLRALGRRLEVAQRFLGIWAACARRIRGRLTPSRVRTTAVTKCSSTLESSYRLRSVRALLQPKEHRKGLFLGDDVCGDRFAGFCFVTPNTEDVVNDLESEAEVQAQGAVMRQLFVASLRQTKCAKFGAQGEENGRLARDHGDVFIDLYPVAHFKIHVIILANGQAQAGFIKAAQGAYDNRGGSTPRSASRLMARCATANMPSPVLIACGFAPNLPHGAPAAAGWAGVFNVIMHQGEIMQNFDRRRGRQRLLPVPAGSLAGEQADNRADALAAMMVHRLELLI